MAGTYSKTVEASVTGGIANCVELPMPPHGILDRLIIKQTSGVDVSFDFKVYSRKGACERAADLHVNAGEVTAVADNGGQAQLTLTQTQYYPYGYELAVGDKLYVKGSNVAAYNVVHTIQSVDSATEFTTDISYTSGITTNGIWQDSEPQVYARREPDMFLVLDTTSGTSGNPSKSFDIERAYENEDNQDVTKRTAKTALWMDLTPGGTGSKTFEIGYTTEVEYNF